jgi:hypothetical protein
VAAEALEEGKKTAEGTPTGEGEEGEGGADTWDFFGIRGEADNLLHSLGVRDFFEASNRVGAVEKLPTEISGSNE